MPATLKQPRRLRVWPAVVWPLGATLLFLGGGALFINKVSSDQQRADAAALRLESYARLEAGDLAARAGSIGRAFVEDRLRRRAEQEKNQHLLLRGVMDGVQRVLGAGLEKARNAALLRDVGDFPTGFEGLRIYLELAGTPDRGGDQALTALRACAPELADLLPSGCSLSVVENNFEELLSLGGGPPPDNARTASLTREFIWGEGEESRHWTLQVALAEPDAHPYPDAAALAAHVAEHLGPIALDRAQWRGWLVDAAGKPAAAFPAAPEPGRADALPPFVDAWDEWVDIDNRRLVWMNRADTLDQVDLTPAVAVAIDRPAPPLVPAEVFAADLRWSSFLTAFALLSVGLWAWFAKTMLAARAKQPAPHAQPAPAPSQPKPQPRLVRADAPQPPPANLILADIDDTGDVHVETVIQPPNKPSFVIPSGSLYRLQERHRGGKNRPGSRALDQTSNKVLKELARRVRPAEKPARAASRPMTRV